MLFKMETLKCRQLLIPKQHKLSPFGKAILASLNNWNEEQKKIVIAGYLQGAAKYFYDDVKFECATYADLVKKLKEEFPVTTDYLSLFFSKKQQGEELLEYFYTIKDLARKAKIVEDTVFIERFLKSIREKERFWLCTKIYKDKKGLRETIVQLNKIYGEARTVTFKLEEDRGTTTSRMRPTSPEVTNVGGSNRRVVQDADSRGNGDYNRLPYNNVPHYNLRNRRYPIQNIKGELHPNGNRRPMRQ
ncbi:hypothetical protein ACJJTC_013110 [Scirpophaga incertulas]